MKTASLVIVIVALKAAFLAADSTIRVYLGDSAAYLFGAMDDGRLPDDRSFTYSFLIRWLVYPFEVLWPLLWWQTLAGVIVAVVLWHILERRLTVPRAAAFAAACALAIEPAQLYYERMVLAEAFGLLGLALFFAAGCAYLTSRRAAWLVAAIALGLLAATVRTNYVPVVLVLSLGLPVVAMLSARAPGAGALRRHLAVAAVAVAALHGGYCYWVGWIFGKPPGYLARAGFLRLGLVLPLVRPEHFASVGLADIQQRLDFPLSDPHARMPHLWAEGGLIRELRSRKIDTDALGRRLSRMAVADDPLGMLRIGLFTVGDYFRDEQIEVALDNDLARREIPPEILWSLREEWGYDAAGVPQSTTTVSRYFERATWWLVACLFALPFVAIANVVRHWRTPQRDVAALAALFATGLVLAHVIFVPMALYRYLHPLPLFVMVNAVPVVVGRVADRQAGRVGR